MDSLFRDSALTDYLGLLVNTIEVVHKQRSSNTLARVNFILHLRSDTNVTEEQIIAAFEETLTGRDNNVVPPNSRVYLDGFTVSIPG